MNLKERIYSILFVSSSGNFASAFMGLISESRYAPVDTVKSISAGKRAIAERTYDFVIINSPLKDDAGIRFAIDICAARQTVVLLLVKSEIYSEIHDKVAVYGVFTLPKPTSKLVLIQALFWMESMKGRLQQFEKKSITIEEKMTEIKLVNKAKWILIRERKMSEPDAHRYIEKQAMDQCVSKKEIAEDIIKTYASF